MTGPLWREFEGTCSHVHAAGDCGRGMQETRPAPTSPEWPNRVNSGYIVPDIPGFFDYLRLEVTPLLRTVGYNVSKVSLL
jgi:hypothetical protein